MSDEDNTYIREVKEFGDGGAHVTLPRKLVDETVKVTPADTDLLLGGTIERVAGERTMTAVTTPGGEQVFAGPAAREQIENIKQRPALGVIEEAGQSGGSGDHFTLPEGVFDTPTLVFGGAGYGRSTFLHHILTQLVQGITGPGGFAHIGLTNDIDALLQALRVVAPNASVEPITVHPDGLVNDPSDLPDECAILYDISPLPPERREAACEQLLDTIAESQPGSGEKPYVVACDHVLPADCAFEMWTDAGLGLMLCLQTPQQLTTDEQEAVAEQSDILSFGVPDRGSAEAVAALLGQSEDQLAKTLMNLRPFQLHTGSLGGDIVRTYPPYPVGKEYLR